MNSKKIHEHLIFLDQKEILGSGTFGTVKRAYLYRKGSPALEYPMAVKEILL